MSRPILKLPAKPAATADDAKPPRRKPVRGGARTVRPSAAPRIISGVAPVAAPSKALPMVEGASTAPADQAEVRAPAPRAERAKPERAPWNKEDAPRREARFPEWPQKVDPKRPAARIQSPDRIRTECKAPPSPRTERGRVSRDAPVADEAAAAAAAEMTAARRLPKEQPRLSKRISELGLCSRREADEWIENGWVSVDGVVVRTLGARVHPNAKIEVKEEAGKHESESVTMLYNAPLDMDLGLGGENPARLIRRETRWVEDDCGVDFKASHLRRLALVGKLDAGAAGMVVFTQEGGTARRIAGDDAKLEKEYLVRVEGELDEEGLKMLSHGLTLDGIKLKRAQVSWQSERQLRMVLHESRKQQIQRMCELVGLRVVSIKRIRIGSVSLGKLPPGEWRYLRPYERF
ncbi:MAG: S4 domain-containing protein [Betaproteobacteria bacterium]